MQNGTYVAHKDDQLGVRALQILTACGQQTRKLTNGSHASPDECAVFSSKSPGMISRTTRSNNRPDEFKLHKVDVPDWAQPAARQVALGSVRIELTDGPQALREAMETHCEFKRPKVKKPPRRGRRPGGLVNDYC